MSNISSEMQDSQFTENSSGSCFSQKKIKESNKNDKMNTLLNGIHLENLRIYTN